MIDFLGEWAAVTLWFVFGVALIIVDIVLAGATFYLVMFGIGAILTSLVAYLFPISVWLQVLVWLALSLVVLGVWLRVFRSSAKVSPGTQELLGETGIVVKTLGKSGSVRFQRPLAGKDQWDFEAERDIADGSRIKVVKVIGNDKVLVRAVE